MADNLTFTQTLMRSVTRLVLRAVTRVRVTGLENVPAQGPLLIVANHLSTIDGPLIIAFLPAGIQFVGPADFKLLFPGDLFIKLAGIIPVRRSTQLERASLKRMSDVLKAGRMLGLFPEGGTWEKPITDAKPGAAYLSLTTGAPILPIGLGGTYQVWYKVGRLRRPVIRVNIGAVIPPVSAPDRARRNEALEAATRDIMERIYALLPPEDQRWYDDQAARRYALDLEVWRGGTGESVALTGGEVLAELMLKPNLMSPLVNNLRLPLDPLRYPGTRFEPAAVNLAVTKLTETLSGTLADYMDYRFGAEKARQFDTALAELLALSRDPGVTGFTFRPRSYLSEPQPNPSS